MAPLHHSGRRSTAACLFGLALAGGTACTTWEPVEYPTTASFNPRPGQRFRVETREGRTMELVAVAIRPDSVTGRLASRGSSDSSVAVSRRDVQGLKRFSKDATGTAVLAVVAVGSVVALGAVIRHSFATTHLCVLCGWGR